MKMIDDFNGEIIDQEYTEKCFLKINIRKRLAEEFKKKIKQLEYLGIHLGSKE